MPVLLALLALLSGAFLISKAIAAPAEETPAEEENTEQYIFPYNPLFSGDDPTTIWGFVETPSPAVYSDENEVPPMNESENVLAFLKTIRYAEGTAGPLGYNTIYGFKYFWDFSKHPNVRIPFKNPKTGKDDFSTAAGAYQINFPTYQDIAPKLGITGFSPADQDAIAIELLRQSGALDAIKRGDIRTATMLASGRWASLPYSEAQQTKRTMQQISQNFVNNGGTLA